MRQIKFTAFGANSAFGSFAPGDTMRCDDALAAHLVDDIKCAQYMAAPATAPAPAPVEAPKAAAKKKAGK